MTEGQKLTFGDITPVKEEGLQFGEVTPITSEPTEETSAFRRTVADPLVSLAKGVVGVPEAVAGIGDIVSGGRVGKALEDVGIRFKDTQDILESFYSPAQQAINKKLAETKGFIPSIVTMVKNPSTIVHGITESAPSMIGGGGIGRLGLKGLSMAAPKLAAKKIAPIVAGAAGEGIMSGGSTAEQIRQGSEGGLLTTGQSAIAAGSGALTSVIGVLGGKLAKRLNIADFETLAAGGGIGAAVNDVTKASKMNILKAAIGSAINEGAIEELPQSAQEQMANNIATGRPVFEGVPEAGAAGLLTGAAMGVGVGGAGRIAARKSVTGATEDVEVTPSKVEAPPTEDIQAEATLVQEGPVVGESTTPDVKDVKVRNLRKEVEEIIKKDKEATGAEAVQQTETVEGKESSPEVVAVRQGDIEEGGAYFSTEGSSTYFDLDNENAKKYNIGDAKLVTSGSPDMRRVLMKALNDSSNTTEDTQRISYALEADNSADNFVDYMLFDEVPSIKTAAESLGFDGVKVWENDDVSDPSSVFIWNTGKVQDLGSVFEGTEDTEDTEIHKKAVSTLVDKIYEKKEDSLFLFSVDSEENNIVHNAIGAVNSGDLAKMVTSELKLREIGLNKEADLIKARREEMGNESADRIKKDLVSKRRESIKAVPKEEKEPVTFIGMQEIGKGRPALMLVNNKEHSTVVFKPETMEITNPEALPKTETTELKISNESPVNIQNIVSFYESAGLSREEALSLASIDMDSITDNPETAPKNMEEFKTFAADMMNDSDIPTEEVDIEDSPVVDRLASIKEIVSKNTKMVPAEEAIAQTDKEIATEQKPSVREQKLAKVKASKAEKKQPKTVTRKKLSVADSSMDKQKLSDSDIDLIIESIYPSLETAEAAHDMLGVDRDKYQVTKLENGYVVEIRDAGGESSENVATKEVQTNPMFQTLEEAAATPRDTSTLLGASKTMLADVNTYLHTGQGDIVSIAKQLMGLVNNVEENPRRFLKEFNEDLASYNEWVDSLNRLAGYITKVQRVQSGTTLDFMGFQNAWNTLVRIYNRWKAARIAHKMKEIEARIDGSDNLVNIENKIPKDIPIISRLWHSSRLPGLNDMPDAARQIINRIIQSELWFRYNAEKESYVIKKMASKYSNEQRKEVTELGYHIQEYSTNMRHYLKKQNVSANKIDAIIRANIEEFLAEQNPKIVEGYKEVRQAYDAWKNRYKEHLIRELNAKTTPEIKNAVSQFITHGNLEKALSDNGIVKKWDRRKFVKYIEEIREINSWGDADYMTHMMIGNITVSEMVPALDKEGKPKVKDGNVVLKRKIITKAKNIEDAIEKAKMYASEKYESGQSPGKIVLDHSFAYDGDVPTVLSRRQYVALLNKINKAISKGVKDINDKKKISVDLGGVVSQRPSQVFAIPTLESKNILPGENDAFDIMQRYSRIMWKKVSYDPVINEMKREIGNFNPRVKEHLEKVLDASKGRYTKGNEFLDDTLRKLGFETSMSYTRGIVNPTVKAIVVSKLGYRPAAAAFNLADGMAKVWMEFREHYVKEGWKFLNTPEGRALVESQGWSFGTKFEEVGGHLKARELASFKEGIKPLGLFTMPELPIRELNYATAYLYYRDQKMAEFAKQGKDINMKEVLEEAASFAKDSAMVSVWKLQGSNTTAERSEILRSPTGRMFGVFMPYFVRNLEFLISHKNSPGFWARYIGYQLTMSGPRGFVAMVKSIPLLEVAMAMLGVDNWWERLELWMINNIPGSGGAASLAGADIVAPATAQFPSSSSTIDTAYKVWKYGLSQIGNPDFRYQTKEGIKQTVIFAKNWWDIIDANIDENGFVLDADGNPKYSITSWWDSTMLANSVTPESKTVQQLTHRIVARQEEIMNEQARKIVSKFRNQLQGAFSKAQDPDVAIEDAVETAQNAILEYHVSPERLSKAIEQLRMSKGMRDIANARLINKGQVLQMNIDMEEEYSGTLIPE